MNSQYESLVFQYSWIHLEPRQKCKLSVDYDNFQEMQFSTAGAGAAFISLLANPIAMHHHQGECAGWMIGGLILPRFHCNEGVTIVQLFWCSGDSGVTIVQLDTFEFVLVLW